MKKILIVLLVFFAVLFVVASAKKTGSISPNILYITQPVTSFSGTVEKITGNQITVSQKLASSQNLLPLANPENQTSPFPTPKMITVTYHIVITDKTQIDRFFGAPALPTTTAPKLTVKDIKIGQLIMVSTTKDLRTLTGNTFEATLVNLPPIADTLNGKIISLEGNILTVKGSPVMMPVPFPVNSLPVAPQEKEYRITITSDTEISRTSYPPPELFKPGEMPQPPKIEKLALSDLKKDMQVTVYTAEDVNETSNLTALRIEPAVIMPTPAVALPPPQISPLVPSITSSPSGTNTITPEKK